MNEPVGPLLIIVLGALAIVALAVVAAIRQRRTLAKVTRLVELALGGRADEARIQARNESAELSPLLEVLGGELIPPHPPRPLHDVLLLALVPLPTLLLLAYGWSTLRNAPEAKVAVASSLLQGIAVLLPISLAAAHAIVTLGRTGRRRLRGACVTLLARNARVAIDAETVEALRRGGNLRDPRGE